MESFGETKADYKAIGNFLLNAAEKKENLSNSEYIKAAREVDDIALGRYDQRQKQGHSMKM